MASNPFGITQVDAAGLLQGYVGLQRARMADLYTRAQFERQRRADEREEAELTRKAQARNLIGQGAKPEAVIAADPETGFSYARHAAAASKEEREALATRAENVGSAALYLSELPQDQFASQWDGVVDKLVGMGYTDLAQFKGKPDRAALGPLIAASEEAVKAYRQGVQDRRDADLRERALVETGRHNRASEGVSAANLALARQREARVTKWGPQPLFGTVSTNTDDLNY